MQCRHAMRCRYAMRYGYATRYMQYSPIAEFDFTVLARRMLYAHTVQQKPHCNTLQNRISLCRSKIKAGLIMIDRTNQNLLDTSALVNGGERQRRDDDSLRIFVTQKHLYPPNHCKTHVWISSSSVNTVPLKLFQTNYFPVSTCSCRKLTRTLLWKIILRGRGPPPTCRHYRTTALSLHHLYACGCKLKSSDVVATSDVLLSAVIM